MPNSSGTYSCDDIPDFGLFYDTVPAYHARSDVPFYIAEAVRDAGPVLELGCGTGRVLLPIARAGATITGLDTSHQMLERCRAKLIDESAETQARVTLQQNDARSFDLGTTFPLVIAPFRILQHLVSIEDQLSCLHAVARHLVPGGRFVFDLFNPHFALLIADRSEEREETPEQALADGRHLRRSYRIPRVRWIEQVAETELIYYISGGSGSPVRRFVHAFDMRWYVRAELLHLLARTGFRVQAIYGDFDRSALADNSPEQVVCAARG